MELTKLEKMLAEARENQEASPAWPKLKAGDGTIYEIKLSFSIIKKLKDEVSLDISDVESEDMQVNPVGAIILSDPFKLADIFSIVVQDQIPDSLDEMSFADTLIDKIDEMRVGLLISIAFFFRSSPKGKIVEKLLEKLTKLIGLYIEEAGRGIDDLLSTSTLKKEVEKSVKRQVAETKKDLAKSD